MTSRPVRNTKISVSALSVLGVGAILALAYLVDGWLAGGIAIRRVIRTCDVLGQGCSDAASAILQIIDSPFQILVTFALAALTFAALRSVIVLLMARKTAARFNKPADDYPELLSLLKELGADSVSMRIADDPKAIAFTYGVVRPTICISSGIVNMLNRSELGTVIAHEWGHVKQRDNLAIFVAMFVRDFLWFLPVSHYLFSVFLREKEYVADDYAVHVTGRPFDLANAIVSVAKAIRNCKPMSPAYATFFSSGATTKNRVNRLLGIDGQAKAPIRSLIISAVLSVLVLSLLGGIGFTKTPWTSNSYNACGMGESCSDNNFTCCTNTKK